MVMFNIKLEFQISSIVTLPALLFKFNTFKLSEQPQEWFSFSPFYPLKTPHWRTWGRQWDPSDKQFRRLRRQFLWTFPARTVSQLQLPTWIFPTSYSFSLVLSNSSCSILHQHRPSSPLEAGKLLSEERKRNFYDSTTFQLAGAPCCIWLLTEWGA